VNPDGPVRSGLVSSATLRARARELLRLRKPVSEQAHVVSRLVREFRISHVRACAVVAEVSQ